MAITKRLRFEIFRRDNHSCRYCGGTAPDVKLTVDHVVPTALGGSDDPTNLVTACADCNSGKSATSPDAPHVADVAQDALRWAAALHLAADAQTARLQADQAVLEHFEQHVWGAWTHGYSGTPFPLPANWRGSIRAFLSAGLTMTILEECVDIACEKGTLAPAARFKYMCGIAWRKVTELQTAAREILAAEDAA